MQIQTEAQPNGERTHITVLIEQKDFTPFAALRRASLTPSLALSSSTVTPGTGTGHNGALGNTNSGGEWRRAQRGSTTLHASIDCPDSLLASLSSIAIGESVSESGNNGAVRYSDVFHPNF